MGFILLDIHQIIYICRNDSHRLCIILESDTRFQAFLITLYEMGVVVTVLEIRHVDDASQVSDVCRQSGNLVFVQYTAHTLYGIFTCGCPYYEFSYHWVIVHRYLISAVAMGIYSCADALRYRQLLYNTRGGHKVVVGIFSTYPTFYGVSVLSQVFLLEP